MPLRKIILLCACIFVVGGIDSRQMQNTVTLPEAKAHFKSYTRSVLSKDARAAMKCEMQWIDGNPPTLILGGVYKLQFHRNTYGQNIVATSNCHFAKDV